MALSIEFWAKYIRIQFYPKLDLKSVYDVDSKANKYVVKASTTHTDRQKL